MPEKLKRARRGRGEGGVYFDESKGLKYGSLSLGFNTKGNRVRRKVSGETKRDVLSQMDALRVQVGAGQLPDAGGLTVGQLLRKWLDAIADRTEARTREERERTINTHLIPRIGTVKLAKFNALQVEALYADLRSAGGWTPRAAADVLNAALNHAVRLKLISSNPAAAIKKPKPPKRQMVVIDSGQIEHFLSTSRTHPLGDLMAVALGTGCRQSELLALTWADVDLERGIIHIRKALSKTKDGYILKDPKSAAGKRSVTIRGFALSAMKSRRAKAEESSLLAFPVFCTRTGNYLDRKNVLRALKTIIKKANRTTPENGTGIPLELKFHGLRHSHASLLLSAGHSLRAVSQRLGHSNPAMTLRVYGHCMPADDAKLADGMAEIGGGFDWLPNGSPDATLKPKLK